MTLVFFFHWLRASTQPLGDLASYFSPTMSIDIASRLLCFRLFTHYEHRHDLSITLLPTFQRLRASTRPLDYLAPFFSPTKSIDTTSRLPCFLLFTDQEYRHNLSITFLPFSHRLSVSSGSLSRRYRLKLQTFRHLLH